MNGEEINWSEKVEDLIEEGKIDEAISFLESVVSNLEKTQDPPQSHLQLSSALFELAKLYSSKGFSLKSDKIRSRAIIISERSQLSIPSKDLSETAAEENQSLTLGNKTSARIGSSDAGHSEESLKLPDDAASGEGCADDDWEAIADCAPEKLLPPQCLSEVSKLSIEDKHAQTPKQQRGRGIFSNRKPGLYSDQQSDESTINDLEEDSTCHASEQHMDNATLKYGTRHVLVLADFPPSTKTSDLERLLENFKEEVFSIRWVNDTLALAVFTTPSVALEARNSILCPFTVRILDENDVLLSSIQQRDLEPPRRRPQTSARTAQRLIAHGMGLRLPSTALNSALLRTQEDARRKRIITRQKMKDDAWGDDAN